MRNEYAGVTEDIAHSVLGQVGFHPSQFVHIRVGAKPSDDVSRVVQACEAAQLSENFAYRYILAKVLGSS